VQTPIASNAAPTRPTQPPISLRKYATYQPITETDIVRSQTGAFAGEGSSGPVTPEA